MTQLILEDYIALLKSPVADERRNAAWVLGRSRDIRIIKPLIASLTDTDSNVRLRVAESLGNLRDESIIVPLLTALEHETEAEVRASLIASLGRQNSPLVLINLITALQDASPVVRSAAAEALSLIPDEQAAAPLVKVLLHDDDVNTRYHVARTLSQIGGANTVQALSEALPVAESPERKIQIAEILGQLRDPQAIDALQTLLNDPDEGVVETATWALRQAGAG